MIEKEKLVQMLNHELVILENYLVKQDDKYFDLKPQPGKWSTGQHVAHLVLSMQPVNKAMRLPKLFLSYKFGTCKRPERSYEATVDRYYEKLKSNNVKAPSGFSVENLDASEKEKYLKRLKDQVVKLNRIVSKWNEKSLSKYILPHPALGRLTMREMMYFSILHMKHHREILENKYVFENLEN